MPVYSGSFPTVASGLTATVKLGATTLGTQAVTGEPNTAGAIAFSYTYEDGNDQTTLTASVSSALLGTLNTSLLLDTAASIAAGSGGVGASETAYFVATGPTYTTAGNGAAGTLTFEADDRHDALPDWASVVDGDIVLTSSAGTCAFSTSALFDMDFSEASAAADAPGTIGTGGVTATLDGDDLATGEEEAKDGDGTDTQTTNQVSIGGLIPSAGTVSVTVFPYAKDDTDTLIADGEASPRVALTITRIAQAAVVPD